MDWYFQIWNINRYIQTYSEYQKDQIDIQFLVDSSLHLPENIENINKILRISRIRSDEEYEMMQENVSNQIVRSTYEEIKGYKHVS
jgi:hypothetical protein